jgi:hypothetical protein
VAKVIKLFWRNYIDIGVTLVKIIGKYAASSVNYALKSFIILATGQPILPLWQRAIGALKAALT